METYICAKKLSDLTDKKRVIWVYPNLFQIRIIYASEYTKYFSKI